MIRKISFTDKGDIRIEGETMTEIIKCGVVLLTLEQARQATEHGWSHFGAGPFTTETNPPLYAVVRR